MSAAAVQDALDKTKETPTAPEPLAIRTVFSGNFEVSGNGRQHVGAYNDNRTVHLNLADGSDVANRILKNVLTKSIPELGLDVDLTDASGRHKPQFPASISRARRTTKFIGREQVLDDIHTALSPVLSNEDSGPISLALIGMGGIGKTQIALKYCERTRTEFHSVFWVQCRSEDSIVSSLATIADNIKAPADMSSPEQKVEFVFEAWSTWPGPCLIIYDNFDDPNLNMQPYLAQNGRLAMLITSRLHAAEEIVDHSIEVDVMSDPEAIDLLLARAAIPKPAADSTEDAYAHAIVRTLGCLPLALDQASAYIREQKLALDVFIRRYETEKATILKHTPKIWSYRDYANQAEKDRYLSVITTWELSLKTLAGTDCDHLGNLHPKVAFLTLAAFLGGHRVSKVLFKWYNSNVIDDRHSPLDQWTSELETQGAFDNVRFRRLVVELNELSLIRGFHDTDGDDFHFSIHTLVQEWARLRIAASLQEKYSLESLLVIQRLLVKFSLKQGPGLDYHAMLGSEQNREQNTTTETERRRELSIELTNHVNHCLWQAYKVGPQLDGSHDVEPSIASFLELSDANSALNMWIDILQDVVGRYGLTDDRTMVTFGQAALTSVGCICSLMDEIAEANIPCADIKRSLDILRFYSRRTSVSFGTMVTTPNPALKLAARRLYFDSAAAFLDVFEGTAQADPQVLVIALQVASVMIEVEEAGDLDRVSILLEKIRSALGEAESTEETFQAQRSFELQQMSLLRRRNQRGGLQVLAREYNDKYAAELEQKNDMSIIGAWVLLHEAHQLAADWKAAASEAHKVYTFCSRTLGAPHFLTQSFYVQYIGDRARGKEDSLDKTTTELYLILSRQRKQRGYYCEETVMLENRVVREFSNIKQHRLAFALAKEGYVSHSKWLSRDDSLLHSIEFLYFTALSQVEDRTLSEIEEVKQAISTSTQDLASAQLELLPAFLGSIGRYREVLDMYTTRIENGISAVGTTSDPGYRHSRSIAESFFQLCEWQKAVDWYAAIVEGRKRDGTVKQEPDFAFDLGRYGIACTNCGFWTRATVPLEEAVAHQRQIFGERDERTLDGARLLAMSYCKAAIQAKEAGDDAYLHFYKQGEAQCHQILDVVNGEDDSDRAQRILSMQSLSEILFVQDDPKKIEEGLGIEQDLVTLQTQKHGAESLEAHVANERVAMLLIKLGHEAEGITLWQKALDWHERTFGADADLTTGCLLRIANRYRTLGRHERALEMYLRGVDYFRRKSEAHSIETLTLLALIAECYAALSNFNAALPYLIETCDGLMGCDPRPEGGMLTLLNAYGIALYAHEWTVAEKFARTMVTAMQEGMLVPPLLQAAPGRIAPHASESRPAEQGDIAMARARLGTTLMLQGRASEAESNLAEVVEAAHEGDIITGDAALTMYHYANCQRQLGKNAVAREYYAQFMLCNETMPADFNQVVTTIYGGWQLLRQHATTAFRELSEMQEAEEELHVAE